MLGVKNGYQVGPRGHGIYEVFKGLLVDVAHGDFL